jgi:Helicase associated domain
VAGFEFEVTKERKVEALKHMDRSWEEFFAELEQYKAKYGQVNVIKQRKKRALREWCDEQRVQYMRMKWGKPCCIEEDQVTKLSELGFVWATTEIPSKGWDEYFADVLIFYIENDSFQIPDEESDLKQWCETQRAEYQKFMSGVPSLLTKYKISKLLDVSFPLGDNVETDGVEAKNSWEEMFSQLLMFKIHNKHLNIPKSMKGLYTWSCQQRQQEKLMQSNRSAGSKRSAIWEERVRRLTEVGFDWEGELPEKTAIPTNCSMFEDSTGTVDDTPLPSHPHRCTIATSTNNSVLHHHGTSLHNPTGYSLPTWTEHVAVPPFLDLTHNNNAGRMVMASNDLQSLTNAMAVSGKSLASQAAQIVAELKNRNCNDSS